MEGKYNIGEGEALCRCNLLKSPQTPMTKDSTSLEQSNDVTITNMKTPKTSTLSYIRQFARVYYTLNGTPFCVMIAN